VQRELGEVTTDPSWWKDTTVYWPAETNPYNPAYGYQHQMCTAGPPPGDLYGAIQRAGELCCKWTADLSGIQYNRVLVPIDCGGGWMCMTQCL